MLPVWALMAMAGAAKGYGDKQQEKRDRHAAAVTKLYQPWTGMQPDAVQTGGGVLGGVTQGAVAGYGVDQSNEQNDMYKNYLDKMGGPGAGTGAQAIAPPQGNMVMQDAQNPAGNFLQQGQGQPPQGNMVMQDAQNDPNQSPTGNFLQQGQGQPPQGPWRRMAQTRRSY